MTLRFHWEWEPAPEVRIPELAATWSRLGIDVDHTPATLVERRDGSGGIRRRLDVPTYPLAEWLAINWWRISAPSHLARDEGVRLTGAGGGFPWPDLTLRSDRGLMWAKLRQRNKTPEHVRFLTQTETVLNADSVLIEVAHFIDETVRRLDDEGISGTLLQDEWRAIQEADREEIEYCLVAAAWGQDPYDTSAEVEQVLLSAGTAIDAALLADLSRAVPINQVNEAVTWLVEATTSLVPRPVHLPSLGPLDYPSSAGMAAWKIGYDRARKLRLLLDVAPRDRAPISTLLPVHHSSSIAPSNVDGLMSSEDSKIAVVVGAGTHPRSARFASARAVARQSLSPVHGRSLITRASRYTDRAERAFAAELLAPAEGIEQVLDGDLSDEAIRRAADHFDVSTLLIQHQIDNQVAA
ncbi:hypothetical protein ACFWQC_01665 [Nocardioides sp. NPDC058538]|uniref:hypothetical protein n=1 Tax=Nocardioides sp. NPDC058538 TaxID=3346542 RepID=UPI0036588DDA